MGRDVLIRFSGLRPLAAFFCNDDDVEKEDVQDLVGLEEDGLMRKMVV
jgi:hypothetical protein